MYIVVTPYNPGLYAISCVSTEFLYDIMLLFYYIQKYLQVFYVLVLHLWQYSKFYHRKPFASVPHSSLIVLQ